MISKIDEYLSQLRNGLAGCDRATIQDAISDTEEYLRNAFDSAQAARPGISEADALPPIIEKYGTPEEVAAAYREIETRVPPYLALARAKEGRSFPRSFFGVVADPRAWGAVFYLLFSLITGIAYFTWAITGISLSASLLILVIGIPFVGLFVLSIRGLSLLEGRVVEALLGVRMPRRPIFSSKRLSLWERFKTILSDRLTWFSMAYMILQLPLGTVYFSLLIALFASSFYLVARPVQELVFNEPAFTTGTSIPHFTPAWLMPFAVIGGFLLFFLTMHLAKLTGKLHGKWAKAMLVRE